MPGREALAVLPPSGWEWRGMAMSIRVRRGGRPVGGLVVGGALAGLIAAGGITGWGGIQEHFAAANFGHTAGAIVGTWRTTSRGLTSRLRHDVSAVPSRRCSRRRSSR